MRTTDTPRPSTRNVTRAYRAASAQDRADGATWYERAHAMARELDPQDVSRAAGVLAALSPQTSWGVNVAWARQSLATGTAVGNTGDARGKAQAILDGADPLDVLGGDKVRAFYALILDPTDQSTVCVDRHAVAIAAGKVLDKLTGARILARKGGYEATADTYRRAGKILGVPPHAVQATTWLYWRRERAVADHSKGDPR